MRTDLGKSGVRVMGAWSSATAYEKNDIVSNGGSSYISIQSVPAGTALSNSSYWLMIAEKGDKGDKGDTGATGATGATGNGISSVEVEETSVVGNVHTYTLTVSMTDGTSEVFTYDVTDGAVTSVNGRTGAVTGLAEDNGYYEDMTVGGAEQLISSTYVEDSVPYVFRTSGGANDIGDREFDEIHGGTIAWNQLNNGVSTSSADGITTSYDASTHKISVTNNSRTSNYASGSNRGTISGTIPNHVYLMDLDRDVVGIKLYLQNSSNQQLVIGNLVKHENAYSVQLRVTKDYDFVSAHPVNDVTSFFLNLIDLTQMFGSTVADYVYSLEQANAGAGVAWFKSLFPKPYYAYNAGQLISVSGLSAHKMTGFNQFNKNDVLNGYITPTDGVFHANASYVSSNYIRVVPNATYYFKTELADSRNGAWYDSNKTYIGQCAYSNGSVVTAPSNAEYIIFGVTSPTSGNADTCCFNLHWDGERDGEYEPYEAHEYALDSDVTLRGIPKLDADNKLYYDGDVYASDGTVQRRYGIVDLGTLTWADASTASSNRRMASWSLQNIIKASANTVVANIICPAYESIYADKTYLSIRGIAVDNTGVIRVYDENYNTQDSETAFTTAMSGVYLVYELATPTTESAEPYTNPQIVDDWGTEEYVIAEQSGVAIPVGHETKYTANLKAKLEMAPNSPSGDGDYIVRQTGGINTYVPLTERIPNAPSEDGNYILKCTVSGSTVTYVWESAT